MRIQKYARAQKRTVPATKFTCSKPLHAIQNIECAAFMQPSALTLTKPQKKTNVCLKFETLGSLGPCGQNKVAKLHFMTKSRLWTKQGRRQKLRSGSSFSQIDQIPEKRGCVYLNLVRLLPPSILRRFRSCMRDLQTISNWPLSGQAGTELFRIALKSQNTSFKGQVF